MASTSVSTASVQKQSTISDVSSSKQDVQRRKSSDTVCSSNSSCFLQKRKAPNPLTNTSIKVYTTRNGGNTTVRQRVLSARLLKLRSIQSQLNDANFHLSELAKENRALITLQKRQDKALLNYEGVNAELPRLIKSHEEEIRVLRERNKTLRRGLKEAAEHLKMKEDELAHVREQLKILTNLAKDKNLGERGKLQEELEETKNKLSKSETQINLLNRKLMLESKNYKFRLNAEFTKNKETQKQLAQAINEIGRLANLMEGKARITLNSKTNINAAKRQSISLISLGGSKPTSGSTYSDTFTEDTTNKLRSASDVKLEPIVHKKGDTDLFKAVDDSVKTRLSAKMNEASNKLENIHISSENDLVDSQQKSIYTLTRPTSSTKLEKIPNIEQNLLNQNSCVEQKFGDYCTQAINTVSTFNTITEQRKEAFETSQSETEKLLNTLKKTDEVNSKLRNNSISEIQLPEKDIDIINKIWNDQIEFQVNNSRTPSERTKKALEYLSKNTDKNGNITKKESSSNVSLENKKKLLATLKAIDNGESIEDIETLRAKKTNILNELFGDLK